MKRWSLASQKYAPRARLTKRGGPPTALKARTGEFTPPGMSALARSNSGIFRSVFGVMGWHHKAFQGLCIVNGGVVFFGVPGIVGAGRGPEHAVGKDMPHSGAKAGVPAPVEVAQRLGGGLAQVVAGGHQGGQRGRQRVASATETGIEQLELATAEQHLGRGQHVLDKLLGQCNP